MSIMTFFCRPEAMKTVLSSFHKHANFSVVTKPQNTFLGLSPPIPSFLLSLCQTDFVAEEEEDEQGTPGRGEITGKKERTEGGGKEGGGSAEITPAKSTSQEKGSERSQSVIFLCKQRILTSGETQVRFHLLHRLNEVQMCKLGGSSSTSSTSDRKTQSTAQG